MADNEFGGAELIPIGAPNEPIWHEARSQPAWYPLRHAKAIFDVSDTRSEALRLFLHMAPPPPCMSYYPEVNSFRNQSVYLVKDEGFRQCWELVDDKHDVGRFGESLGHRSHV
jgi:hypothetical protein